jgi:hypothetical protein
MSHTSLRFRATLRIICHVITCDEEAAHNSSPNDRGDLFSHSCDNTGGTHATIFCLFDLMLKKSDNGRSFSTKAVLVDDNECD